MEDNYSNRELDAKFTAHEEIDGQRFKELNDKMDEHFEATTNVQAQILEQTQRTNGSVAAVKEWKAFATGGFTVLSGVVVFIIFPLCGYVLWRVSDLTTQTQNTIQDTTRAAVIEALKSYKPNETSP